MELPEERMRSLAGLQDVSSLPEEAFLQILETVLSRICNSAEGTPKLPESKPVAAKAAFSDLSCLLVEAARNDLDEESLRSFLCNAKLTGPRARKIVDAYAPNKRAIQDRLGSIGKNPAHIVDVDWRLDYCVKYDTCNSVGVPLYHVRLTAREHRKDKHVTFTCTVQQLQELVSKLKDACRHLEKLTNV